MLPKQLLTQLLLLSNPRFPVNNSHYVTGTNIVMFSNAVCVEKTLTNFSNNLKCMFNSPKIK